MHQHCCSAAFQCYVCLQAALQGWAPKRASRSSDSHAGKWQGGEAAPSGRSLRSQRHRAKLPREPHLAWHRCQQAAVRHVGRVCQVRKSKQHIKLQTGWGLGVGEGGSGRQSEAATCAARLMLR